MSRSVQTCLLQHNTETWPRYLPQRVALQELQSMPYHGFLAVVILAIILALRPENHTITRKRWLLEGCQLEHWCPTVVSWFHK